jgi:prepilin-type N-terminal cleavage/methylation domain-containing protein/prepilin-type processing-associated H-X9-DG protein
LDDPTFDQRDASLFAAAARGHGGRDSLGAVPRNFRMRRRLAMTAIARCRGRAAAFTLVELLVVIAIIGVLVALLLPAVQAAREAARRAQCQSNIKNVALAILSNHDAKGAFPTPIYTFTNGVSRSIPEVMQGDSLRRTWTIEILPYLEQQTLYAQFQWRAPTGLAALLPRAADGAASINAIPVSAKIPVLLCPSDNPNMEPFQNGPAANPASWGRCNYLYNSAQFFPSQPLLAVLSKVAPPTPNDAQFLERLDYNVGMGVIDGGGERTIAQLSDGTTHTIMLAESRIGVAAFDRRGVWAMGMCGSNFHCRHAFNNVNGVNSCTGTEDDVAGMKTYLDEALKGTLAADCMAVDPWASGQSSVKSRHPGGAYGAMADGSVKFLGDFIDPGQVTTGVFIGDTKSNKNADKDITEASFGVWQRMNVSADGYIYSLPQ